MCASPQLKIRVPNCIAFKGQGLEKQADRANPRSLKIHRCPSPNCTSLLPAETQSSFGCESAFNIRMVFTQKMRPSQVKTKSPVYTPLLGPCKNPTLIFSRIPVPTCTLPGRQWRGECLPWFVKVTSWVPGNTFKDLCRDETGPHPGVLPAPQVSTGDITALKQGPR